MCISRPGSNQGEDPKQIYSSATADLDAKGRSHFMQQPPKGSPNLVWPIPPWPAEILWSPGPWDKQAEEPGFQVRVSEEGGWMLLHPCHRGSQVSGWHWEEDISLPQRTSAS